MAESTRTALDALRIPARVAGQSLLGYARQHIELIESAIAVGIKKAGLVLALQAAGFSDCRPRTLERVLYHARRNGKSRGHQSRSPSQLPILTAPAPKLSPVVRQPEVTAEKLRRTSGFQYDGTANLDIKKLI